MFCDWNSGGTLLAILLNNHPDLVCNGETFPFGHEKEILYRCSCGERLDACEFYSTAGRSMMTAGTSDWDKGLFRVVPRLSANAQVDRALNSVRVPPAPRELVTRLVPAYAARSRAFRDAHVRFMTDAVRLSGAHVYVDGTKNLRRAELMAGWRGVSLKAIHMVRDGRGVCYSFFRKRETRTEKQMVTRAESWLAQIGMVDAFSARHPDVPVLTVRYEDLCRDTDNVLGEICEFAGVRFEPRMISAPKGGHHILGNPVRKNFDGRITEDLRWQDLLPGPILEKVSKVMADGLRRFQYV